MVSRRRAQPAAACSRAQFGPLRSSDVDAARSTPSAVRTEVSGHVVGDELQVAARLPRPCREPEYEDYGGRYSLPRGEEHSSGDTFAAKK
jgi:hypothetical protein